MAKPFDLLSEFGKFGIEQQVSLRDPQAKASFVSHVATVVDTALKDPLLLHGQRTQAIFEALLVSLGEFKLLKEEDCGRFFPADTVQPPDFRVVLNNGEQWLIEVKNVYEEDPYHQKRRLLRDKDLRKLEEYAALTGARLKVGVFLGTLVVLVPGLTRAIRRREGRRRVRYAVRHESERVGRAWRPDG